MRCAIIVSAAALLAFSGLAAAAGNGGPAAEGQVLFKADCASCHTIGGGNLVGPDLEGIVATAGESTVRGFIADPTGMIASGNPTIGALVTKFHGVHMPDLGLTPAQVSALVAFLQTQGGSAAHPATTPSAPVRPAVNPAVGKALFTGATQLAHGGPACISCHTIAGVGSLGGGQVGPDLTRAATKYGGAKGLASVLASIPFPKMVPIYDGHPLTTAEQADLAAFLVMLAVWPRRRALAVRRRIAPTSTVPRD